MEITNKLHNPYNRDAVADALRTAMFVVDKTVEEAREDYNQSLACLKVPGLSEHAIKMYESMVASAKREMEQMSKLSSALEELIGQYY